jgi:chromosome segregation ATPase
MLNSADFFSGPTSPGDAAERLASLVVGVDAVAIDLAGTVRRHPELSAGSSARGAALGGGDPFTQARQFIDQMERELGAREAALEEAQATLAGKTLSLEHLRLELDEHLVGKDQAHCALAAKDKAMEALRADLAKELGSNAKLTAMAKKLGEEAAEAPQREAHATQREAGLLKQLEAAQEGLAKKETKIKDQRIGMLTAKKDAVGVSQQCAINNRE